MRCAPARHGAVLSPRGAVVHPHVSGCRPARVAMPMVHGVEAKVNALSLALYYCVAHNVAPPRRMPRSASRLMSDAHDDP